MSNKAKIATIDGFIAELASTKGTTEQIFEDVPSETVEQHAADIKELADKVEKEYDQLEADLDEEEEGAIERLEALESVKDQLVELSEKMEEVHTFLDGLDDRYSDLQEALNNAKADL